MVMISWGILGVCVSICMVLLVLSARIWQKISYDYRSTSEREWKARFVHLKYDYDRIVADLKFWAIDPKTEDKFKAWAQALLAKLGVKAPKADEGD